MNWDAIGAIGEIIGALAVVASLVYLSVQIRKSDMTARAQSLQSVLDGQRDRSFLPLYTNSELADLLARGLTDFDSLEQNEKRQFFAYIWEQLFQMQQVMQLYEQGLLPKVDFDAWQYATASYLQSPGGKAVWPQIESGITPTIRDLMNNYLRDHPDSPSILDLAPLWIHKEDGKE